VQGPEDRQVLGGDEDRFSVVFRIEPDVNVSGPPPETSDEAVIRRLQRKDADLRTRLDEIARKPPLPEGASTDPDLRFEVVDLQYRQGSIELLVILGVVYAGIKDYETVRKSLKALMRDMREVIQTVLNDVSPLRSVARGSIRATSVTVREREVPGQSTQSTSQVSNEATSVGSMSTSAASVLQLRRWIASNWVVLLAVLYLAVTNILLIVFLGFLLLRMA
jgi:hypothetical protein